MAAKEVLEEVMKIQEPVARVRVRRPAITAKEVLEEAMKDEMKRFNDIQGRPGKTRQVQTVDLVDQAYRQHMKLNK